MPIYRAYTVDRSGHIQSAKVIAENEDSAAIKATSVLVSRHQIELWDRARLVAKFDPVDLTVVKDSKIG